ncbi:response regulator transcription factor [Streptomyces sp. NPDC088560]|uniref:response regulator transcription factor n=1 Tax=Streptomyces sp. NPDC088560 TaxID=3365868 RepID=UPI003814B930
MNAHVRLSPQTDEKHGRRPQSPAAPLTESLPVPPQRTGGETGRRALREHSATVADTRIPRHADEQLTAQELRIAELAGRELSNQEIGELLGLAPRAVQAHLYRIFSRLRVTARSQLTEVVRNHEGP